ncbi:deleted in malignant brain tumors 1 protein-like [Anneissia japonica]|uniref:deleted in malignant brain tumors 1 protein-like n=1 Tax=Anneissia japonica TaxID=1529436 RepID=UPI001425B862|nr:deleted in malignant brain tumors 1 protein-like [Anneissia japonica]
MEYRWTFRTRYPGSLLSIKFNHFDIEKNYDYVLIFSDGEQIASYTGSQIPSTLSAKAPLTVVFQSDYFVTASGFEAEISGLSNGIYSDFDDGWSGWNPYPYSSSSYQSFKRSSEKIIGDDTNRYSASEYYSYIESSSGNSQRYGYLDSTIIPSTWSDGCIEFYYYMTGGAYQHLYVKHYIGSNGKYLMLLYYYLGTEWQYGRVQFISGSSSNKIRFEGEVDHGSTGNKTILAIDDVYISEGKCPPITDGTCFGYQTLKSSSENLVGNADTNIYSASDGICSDFDDGWSGWNPHPYSSSGHQSWKRSSGKLTGDDTNRYSGSDDYYTYIESSSGNSQPYGYFDSAALPTTWSDGCIEFYYYMSGLANQLHVRHVIGSSQNNLMVLYYSGTGWQYGRVQFISGSSSNKIRFRGYVIHGSTSSKTIIAIDDVYISEGKCSHTQDATVPPTSNINLSTLQDGRTTSPSMKSKLNVICSDSYMTVYLDPSISKDDNVQFLDPTCTAAGIVYRNDSRWIYLYTRYDQCQTTQTSTTWSTTYRNQVIIFTHTNYEIYRKEDLHFTVECEVKNRGRAAVGFAPEGAGEDYFKRESGNLTFTMVLYTNASYSTPYSSWQYPVKLDLGSKAFVGASVETFGNDMVLFADSCKTTPNSDSDASPQYQLIENGCGVDSTVDFDGQSTVNKTSRVFFSFETFGFRDYSTVFVHCQLFVCNGSDVQCRRDCQQRGRRDVSAPNKLSDTIPIAIGPVILKRPDDGLDVILDTKDSTSGGIFPALSTTLLFAVCLVMLAVACVLWIKSRANNRNSYQKLETNVDEMM